MMMMTTMTTMMIAPLFRCLLGWSAASLPPPGWCLGRILACRRLEQKAPAAARRKIAQRRRRRA